MACVESGVSFITDIFIMEPEAKPTIDKGKDRTVADNLVLEYGEAPVKAAIIATSLAKIIVHDKSNTTDWARAQSASPEVNRWLTQQLIEESYIKNRIKIKEAAEWAHDLKKSSLLISKGMVVTFLFLASREYGEEPAYSFLETILKGYEIKPETTADYIRSALIATEMKQRKMTSERKLYTVCRGFQSVMAGRNPKTLFQPGQDAPPRFKIPPK